MTVDLSRFGPRASAISQYVDILASRGIERGLIGPREADRIWERHILNSIAVSDLIPVGSDVADVGSGAGLPGIPLALFRPDLRMTLVEPLLRRFTFLTEVVEELGLQEQVVARRSRADELDDRFDVVTARALAPLSRLLTWCADLVRPGGQILAIKGQTAAGEIAESAPYLRRRRLTAELLTVRADVNAEPTAVVRVAFPSP
ncbi:MAG: 16S rRNA (guanine(527)-N(7))-methyltransferase RsmG [Propionibacteriaceae bacterium]